MTREELVAKAIATYGFRERRPHEDRAAYLDALIRHVHDRDFAAAHELRVGRAQADWTPEDAAQFRTRLERIPYSAHELSPGMHAFQVVHEPGPYATDEPSLLTLADRGLDHLADLRTKAPERSLPILASVILMTGEVLTTLVGRDERIAVIKLMARSHPVFGYFVVFDGFVHTISDPRTGEERAQKRDALLAQIGTREMRVMKVRTYTVTANGVTFDAPRPDVDMRALDPGTRYEDPYASIFVTVPTPTGPPS